MNTKALALACLLLVCQASRGSAAAGSFVVIVNAANPASAVARDLIANIFLKKVKSWSTGEKVKPVDLRVGSGTREAFSRSVLAQGAELVDELWQRQIFEGQDVPPPRKASEAEVIDYVARNPGAIGYVAQGSVLRPGVKALHIQAQ